MKVTVELFLIISYLDSLSFNLINEINISDNEEMKYNVLYFYPDISVRNEIQQYSFKCDSE